MNELNNDELAALKRHAVVERRRMLALRDGFQPDTKSYADYQYRAEFWDNIVAKLTRALDS